MADKLRITLVKSPIGAIQNRERLLKPWDLRNYTRQLKCLTTMPSAA